MKVTMVVKFSGKSMGWARAHSATDGWDAGSSRRLSMQFWEVW
jgi:hypothetical protein